MVNPFDLQPAPPIGRLPTRDFWGNVPPGAMPPGVMPPGGMLEGEDLLRQLIANLPPDEVPPQIVLPSDDPANMPISDIELDLNAQLPIVGGDLPPEGDIPADLLPDDIPPQPSTPEEKAAARKWRETQQILAAGTQGIPTDIQSMVERLWKESGVEEDLALNRYGERVERPGGRADIADRAGSADEVQRMFSDPRLPEGAGPRVRENWVPNPARAVVPGIPEDWEPTRAEDPMEEFREFSGTNQLLDEKMNEQIANLDRDGDGIITDRERASLQERGMAELRIKEGHKGDPFKTDLEIDERFRRLNPDINLEGEPLGPHTTRRKFGAAQGVMVRVPPQLRGKHGFSGEAIQLVAPEQAEGMRALMAEVSEEDAVRAAQDTGIGAAGRTQRDGHGRETSVDAIGADVTGSDRLRYVAGPAEGGVARSPTDYGAGKAGAIFDARFHELDPETGQPGPRGDYRSQTKAAYEGDALRLSPSRIRRLAADPQLDLVADPETGRPNLQILPTEYDKERSKLFFSAMEKRKADKAKRLATRRRRSRERYGQQGGDPYINVPRFPGESDAAYAHRYSAMAGALGQSMTGGGDMGGMMGMMGNMFPAIMNYMLQQGQQGDSRRQQGIMNAMTQVAQAQAALDTWQQNNQGRNPAQSVEAKPLLAALAEAKSRVTQLQNSPQARPPQMRDFFGGGQRRR